MTVSERQVQQNNRVDGEQAAPPSAQPRTAPRVTLSPLHLATLALILLVAVAARVALWRWQAASGAVPPGDPEEYYRAALHILRGGYHDTGKWLRPPAYPALLALLLLPAGMDVARALLLQAALLGVGALAFYALGRQLFGPRAGLASAAVAALLVPLAAFGPALYAEALFVTLLALALAALDRALAAGPRWALAAGALLGLATLTRAVGLFLIPLAALFLLLAARGHEGARARAASADATQRGGARAGRLPMPMMVEAPAASRRAVLPFAASVNRALALLVGAALVIAPWTARNYAAHGRLIVVDTNGGISMWYGAVRSPEEKAARDEELFAVPNLADRQALALRWTAERALEDPAAFVGRARFKLASLMLLQTRSYAAGDVLSLSPAGESVVQNAGELPLGLTLLADAQYIAVMLLGIAGVCLMPDPRRALPTLLWIAVSAGLAALTIGHPRLRLPIVAALIPFCAFALLRLPAWAASAARWARGRREPAPGARRLVPLLAGWALFLALIASARYLPFAAAERYAVPGRAALAAQDTAAAEALFARARDAEPGNALRLLALADTALAAGRHEQADERYRQALDLEPRSIYAHAMRALLAARLGRPDAARDEVAAIDRTWRAGDDLYRWAWGHPLARAQARLVPGDPAALGHYRGFAPATPDLPAGRWTLGEGQVRVASTCGELVLRLQGPAGRVATVQVEEFTEPQTVTLTGAPQEVRLPLGAARDCELGPPVIVTVRSATGLLDLEAAPWYVGVAVLEARAEP